MPLLFLLPVFVLLLPAIEIAVFIIVGAKIGVLATLGLVAAGILIGGALLRSQGIRVLTRLRSEMDAGRIPGTELVEGALLAVAALMVLTPGFVTSGLGFLLLVPPIRHAIASTIQSRMTVTVATRGTTGGGFRRRDGVVDLDPEDYSSHEGHPPRPGTLPRPGD
ncbi:Suppressor of F exclusion of phage T7 [Hartmannibacter diazotrophicus]|uniref:Suppressor of F exclusion of phage T7 n=1 Tax=Hartmannibacter diazotrophicus TaxID=1482074 RepID=A0A2C9CZX0_9HYPH|nr:FxsA family protein [Hartmannibacter diazotrophicus]SON53546.1 Suppressor of F exclusion of phage T7 [Hartmannibacter diazotrophicus]